jgi:hypothetical protein
MLSRVVVSGCSHGYDVTGITSALLLRDLSSYDSVLLPLMLRCTAVMLRCTADSVPAGPHVCRWGRRRTS